MNPISSSSSSSQNGVVVQNALNISGMPVELIEQIASHLDFGSLLELSRTSKSMNAILRYIIRPTVTSAYESYGALARCESEINNAQKLIDVSSATLGLISLFPTYETLQEANGVPTRGILIHFDPQGVPSFLKYCELIETDPGLKTLGGKGSFYRGDYIRKIQKVIDARFEQFEKIFKEFIDRPLNELRPLQDLRGRATRVGVMETEIKVLSAAFGESMIVYNKVERSMWVLTKKILDLAWLLGYDFEIPVTKLLFTVTINSFCKKMNPLLGAKKMLLGKRKVAVEIYGGIKLARNFKKLSKVTALYINVKGSTVAVCELFKTWQLADGRSVAEGKSMTKREGTRENRNKIIMRVKIQVYKESDYYKYDNESLLRKENNYKVILKNLFDQLAAEILLREDFPSLSLSERPRSWMEIPELTLYKSDSMPVASSSTTKVSQLRDAHGNTALVPFVSEPTTWEEHLSQSGHLLCNPTEPLLPKFITKDFESSLMPTPS